MKRPLIFNNEFWGSVVEWLVQVYLSRADKGTKTVDFDYVDPEARNSVLHKTAAPVDSLQKAKVCNIGLEEFINALHPTMQAEFRTRVLKIESVQLSGR